MNRELMANTLETKAVFLYRTIFLEGSRMKKKIIYFKFGASFIGFNFRILYPVWNINWFPIIRFWRQNIIKFWIRRVLPIPELASIYTNLLPQRLLNSSSNILSSLFLPKKEYSWDSSITIDITEYNSIKVLTKQDSSKGQNSKKYFSNSKTTKKMSHPFYFAESKDIFKYEVYESPLSHGCG